MHHFRRKVHHFELKLHSFSALVCSTPHLLTEKNGSQSHIFRPSVCSFALSSLTLRTSMSAKLRTLRRQVALAWILLLALLPQIVVKSLHYHDSVPTCSTLRTDAQAAAAVCADCLREAAAQAVQQGRFATAPTAKWPEGIGKKSLSVSPPQRPTGTRSGKFPSKLQHLPFRPLALHRPHGYPVLFFRFHTGNSLCF